MSKPLLDKKMPQKAPYVVEVEANRKYFWCACGRSDSQPFCDGSHRGTDIEPIEFSTGQDKTIYFCGCKASAGAPLCDGSHNKL